MMRSITLLTCLVFSSVNAQNDFSFVTHEQWANYAAMDIQGTAIAMAGFLGQCDAPYVTYLDKNTGEELWSSSEAAMYYGTYTDVKFAPDGSFWAVGWRRQADDVPYDQAGIITHFSAAGQVLFHQEVLDDAAYEENIMSVQPLPNGQVVWSTGLTVQRLNDDGTTELSWSFDELPVTRLAVLAPDVFAVSTYNSVFFKDALGDPQEIYTSNTYITDLKATEEGIYWAHDDRLFFYDFISTEINEWPLPQNFTNAMRLNITESEVQVYSTGYSPHFIAKLLPDQSAVVITNTWETPDRTLWEMIEEGGTYYQMGNDLFQSALGYSYLSHGYVRKTTGLPPITGPDIGITGINMIIDSFNLYISDVSYQVNASWSGEIQVTNYGDTPVDHFLIGGPIQGNFNCAEGRFFSEEDITIAANSSIAVPITYRSYHWVNLDEEGDFTINLELCLYTAAPNSELDEDTTNDHFCETFVVVDTEEQLPVANELQIFPNPTNDLITLSLPGAQLHALQVYDQTGRLMLQRKLSLGEREEVALGRLPAGMYWLKVVTSDGVISQKISKQ
jgi:hypothetical protein